MLSVQKEFVAFLVFGNPLQLEWASYSANLFAVSHWVRLLRAPRYCPWQKFYFYAWSTRFFNIFPEYSLTLFSLVVAVAAACFCWRKSLRGHDLWLNHKLDLGNQRLLPPFPCPWNVHFPTLPIWGTVSRMYPWESRVLLRTLGLCMWLQSFKASTSI